MTDQQYLLYLNNVHGCSPAQTTKGQDILKSPH